MPHSNPGKSGLIAIDTSTEQAAIAISADNGIRQHVWPAARAQTTSVLPEIDRLVREAGLTPQDVSGLIVATGPGTFTGLRVGISIAKGIVIARGVPLVGIPTLDIVFAMHPGDELTAVLPAGRGRVVWQRQGEKPRNSTIAELIDESRSQGLAPLVGELSSDQFAAIKTAGIEVRSEYRDPAVLLKLGADRIDAGDVDDAVTLEPTYLHGVTVTAGPVEDRLGKQ